MSNLFVPEEETQQEDYSNQNYTEEDYEHSKSFAIDDEDDPVISTIPIHLSSKRATQSINMLQYPGRPKARPYSNNINTGIVEARIKPKSGVVEVDVPLDTTKFYDMDRAEKWTGLQTQTLSGVLTNSDGYYLGAINSKGKLVLLPVDSNAQLRPNFQYIDDIDSRSSQARKTEFMDNNKAKASAVHIVQMSVKSASDNIPRLGGALQASKKSEEEPFTDLAWYDKEYVECEDIRKSLMESEQLDNVLVSDMSNESYINLLVKDTRVD